MFRKSENFSMFLVLIFVIISSVCKPIYAQTTIEFTIDPDETTITAGSGEVVIIAETTSESEVEFTWKLRGPGKFDGSTTDSVVIYIPPDKIETTSEKAIITVTVSDSTAKKTTKSKVFTIIPNVAHLTPVSQVRLVIYRKPKKNESGWQPKNGVKVVTEEGVSGTTGDPDSDFKLGYVYFPVYKIQPLEVIHITVGGKPYKVPTFGPKKGIKGDCGSVILSPEGELALSNSICPDEYKYLKENYGFDLLPGDRGKKLRPWKECRYPEE